MLTFRNLTVQVAIATLTGILVIGVWQSTVRAQSVSFKDDVFPIIELRCLECHQPGGEGYEKSGMDLRTYESLMKGTKFGSVITPRSTIESSLIAMLERRTSREIWMPHNRKKLSKCERRAFSHWVAQGARKN